ncbi:PhoP regulatory network YrbL family protein [Aliarcobacter skirrowii]|uniref:PhoP regulatory network YrbL family protein n=1 Tax=Aliarcobacter skirrowii TaxID=28200 RepID=UPI0021B26945|nr:PhoP regulatory network YrbL family protein [Aliarcobacter skirrowii]MCT7447128.1 PhoP regulatory network YrbL family protein [Aliarcobacter skirrowii]
MKSDEIIVLKDDFIIGKGTTRVCYEFFMDTSKVIKINYAKKMYKNQNFIEYIYFKYLEKTNVPLTHISKTYNFVNTNMGRGLVYDKVVDYNKKLSKTLYEVINQSKFCLKEENRLIEELKEYIFKYKILFLDIALENILCSEYKEGKYKLVIIDGIGGTSLAKLILYKIFKGYGERRVERKWNFFINKVEILRNHK